MYSKNKAQIEYILFDYKNNLSTKEQCIQAIQNIIGEEIERKDIKDVYEVEDENQVQKDKI